MSAGIVKTGMWLTTREQEIILAHLEFINFFRLPETIYAQPNVVISPDQGAQWLRVKYKEKDKTVIWYYPLPADRFTTTTIIAWKVRRDLLRVIIESKPEYKALPPVKGGYQ